MYHYDSITAVIENSSLIVVVVVAPPFVPLSVSMCMIEQIPASDQIELPRERTRHAERRKKIVL